MADGSGSFLRGECVTKHLPSRTRHETQVGQRDGGGRLGAIIFLSESVCKCGDKAAVKRRPLSAGRDAAVLLRDAK